MPTPPIRNLLAGQSLSSEESGRLLRTARQLADAAACGRCEIPLRGRHVAIAGPSPRGGASKPMEIAATTLGAHVSHIGERALVTACDPMRLGRMLGSLYDAIDCESLAPQRARELQRLAGVPVFDGLATPGRPIASLVATLQGEEPGLTADEALSRLLQAALLETMS